MFVGMEEKNRKKNPLPTETIDVHVYVTCGKLFSFSLNMLKQTKAKQRNKN